MRRREDTQKIRKIVLEGPKSWGELLKPMGLSPSVLKNRIDYLLKIGELKTVIGTRKGRRTTLYKLADEEKTKAKIQSYAAINFIGSIHDPIHSFRAAEDRKTTVSVFMSSAQEQGQKLVDKIIAKTLQKSADNIATIWLQYAEKRPMILKKVFGHKTKSGVKVAVVITNET